MARIGYARVSTPSTGTLTGNSLASRPRAAASSAPRRCRAAHVRAGPKSPPFKFLRPDEELVVTRLD